MNMISVHCYEQLNLETFSRELSLMNNQLNDMALRVSGNDNTSALKKLSRLRRPMRDQRHRVKRFWWILIACWLFRCYTPRGK